jgi:sugar O-acyltransferase (sialic acid O-acetyltransferase NeuD family)
MKDIIIIGAGGFGREVKCLIEDVNRSLPEKIYNILGFIDDGLEEGIVIHDLQVLGGMEYLLTLEQKPSLVLGIGAPGTKETIQNSLKEYDFPSIIHPSVDIGGFNISIGKGCVICKGSILTCDISIGNYITINLMCTIGHDSVIKDYSSLMPSVNISGEVLIEANVFIGTGATVINQITVGSNTIVGAGAVVSKSLPMNCTAVGVPAKPILFHNKNE